MDASPLATAARVILVEGASDAAALETLAARLGRPLSDRGTRVVPMGGATNVRRYADRLGPGGLGLALTGLCDAAERRFFEAVLPVQDVHVCHADLEEELVRAAGPDQAVEVVRAQGDVRAWHRFQRQPAQRDRTPEQQLRRFFSAMSGRKERYAAALVLALPADRIPTPLAAVLAPEGE